MLQDQAHTMLIHAKQGWPEAMTSVNLWSYMLRMTNEMQNLVPKSNTGISLIQKFSGMSLMLISTPAKHWHHFGCPVYSLCWTNTCKTVGRTQKWESTWDCHLDMLAPLDWCFQQQQDWCHPNSTVPSMTPHLRPFVTRRPLLQCQIMDCGSTFVDSRDLAEGGVARKTCNDSTTSQPN